MFAEHVDDAALEFGQLLLRGSTGLLETVDLLIDTLRRDLRLRRRRRARARLAGQLVLGTFAVALLGGTAYLFRARLFGSEFPPEIPPYIAPPIPSKFVPKPEDPALEPSDAKEASTTTPELDAASGEEARSSPSKEPATSPPLVSPEVLATEPGKEAEAEPLPASPTTTEEESSDPVTERAPPTSPAASPDPVRTRRRLVLDELRSAAQQKNSSERHAAHVELLEQAQDSPALVGEVVETWCEALGASLRESGHRGRLEAARLRAQELHQVRHEALEKIRRVGTAGDSERKAALKSVQKIWGSIISRAPASRIVLEDSVKDLVARAHRLQELRASLPAEVAGDPGQDFELLLCVPGDTRVVTVRNMARSPADRQRLDRNERSYVATRSLPEVEHSAEIELFHLVDSHREMFGLRRLHFDAALYRAAQQASKECADAAGEVAAWTAEGKPGFEERMRKAGYASPAGESQYTEGRAPWEAYKALCNSPADHRNLLFPSHRDMAAARVDHYWTLSFGGDELFTENLSSP